MTRKHFRIMADALVASLQVRRKTQPVPKGVMNAVASDWSEEDAIKAYVEVLARNYANFNTSRFVNYVAKKLQEK